MNLAPSTAQRQDPLGNPLPDNYQPLKNQAVKKVSEMFISGVNYDAGSIYKGMYDDVDNIGVFDFVYNKNSMTITGTTDLNSDWYGFLGTQYDVSPFSSYKPTKSIAVDLDNDGIDEVVMAVVNTDPNDEKTDIYVFSFTNEGTTVTWKKVATIPYNRNTFVQNQLSTHTLGSITVGIEAGMRNYFGFMDLAAGDLDGDGYKDIIYTVGNNLSVLRNTGNKNLTLATQWSDPYTAKTVALLRIATGDFDIDGADELVVASNRVENSNNAAYYIFKGFDLTEMASGLLSLYRAEVVTGDFDNDGLTDIAFGGLSILDTANAVPLNLRILKTGMVKNGNQSVPKFDLLPPYTDIANRNYRILEPMTVGSPFGGGDQGRTFVWMAGWNFYVDNGQIVKAQGGGLGDDTVRLVEYADLTGDGQDELICIWGNAASDTSNAYSLTIYQYMTGLDNTNAGKRTEYTLRLNQDALNKYPSLCFPNVTTHDSFIVKFIKHQVEFTDPIISAVVASPPYVKGVNDNGEGHTTFGKSVSSGEETGLSNGVSVEASIGAAFKFSFFGLASVETEISAVAGSQFMWGTTESWEYKESWGYNTTTGTDMVVFTAFPYDVYYYEILQSPADSDAEYEQEGDLTMISIPRKPLGPVTMSVEEFNARNKDYQVARGSGKVLRHNLGEPYTYATSDDIPAIKALAGNEGLFISYDHKATVGTEGTSTTLTVERSSLTTDEYSASWDVGIKTHSEAGPVVIDTDVRYQGEYTHDFTVGDSTFIEGEVPGLPGITSGTDHWGQNAFAWGIMCYPYQDDSQAFPVVTYWVDKAN